MTAAELHKYLYKRGISAFEYALELSQRDDWQPIETAPEGRDIIVYTAFSGVDKMFRNGENWYHQITDDPKQPWPYKPTQWKSLPLPPQVTND